MSDRLLSGVSGHTDYPGFGSYPDTGYGTPDAYGSAAAYEGAQQWTATTAVPQVAPQDPWYGQQHTFAADPWNTAGGHGATSLHDAPTSTVPVMEQGGYPGVHTQGYDGGYPQATGDFGVQQHGGITPGYPAQVQHDHGAAAYAQGGPAEYADAHDTYDNDAYGNEAADPYAPEQRYDADPYDAYDAYATPETHDRPDATTQLGAVREDDDEPAPAPESAPGPEVTVDVTPPPRAAGRGRRRSVRPRARSAFLTVAAPSLCVLGVTAVATAATVNDTTGGAEDRAPVAAPDPAEAGPIEANEQFDTQLVSLSTAADDYAERASRTQGRMDLEVQQEAEAEAAAEEAARIEAARPKFFVPVEQHGLSAYYGQAGVNWMSQHTGIDFPVSYGSPVLAATDGTISTQWHPSYGNLVVLTAADGTETWYAHLDSSAYQSGWVQAGTVIAYSGNSGNSTGPHLHFEVRPGGGSAIDPLTWLRSHGLEPT
ncbi:M23 family metallopeptidase [Streptomyces avicenniae]|uniref:M23 family metallopeptidase n=1 Tax=Streptomyces avicenniae TaxID=500153 RepID=UPI000699C796|nr:M23 family metallopeptidase [Streptomyces avicenniae]